MQNFPNSLVTPDNVVPVVGMGATLCYGSDRYPAQVVRVSPSGKTCWIKSVADKVISGSTRDGSAKYEYGAVNDKEREQRVNKSASGGWKRQGGTNVWLGRQERYSDPSF